MLVQDRSASDAAISTGSHSFLNSYSGELSILTSHLKPKARFTRTIAVLKQCAWCGAVEVAGRFFLHHRLSSRGWLFQLRVSSWLLVTAGISHGLCDSCADGIRQRHRAEREASDSAQAHLSPL